MDLDNSKYLILLVVAFLLVLGGTFLTVYYGKLWDRSKKEPQLKVTVAEKVACVFGIVFMVVGMILFIYCYHKNVNLYEIGQMQEQTRVYKKPLSANMLAYIGAFVISFIVGLLPSLFVKSR